MIVLSGVQCGDVTTPEDLNRIRRVAAVILKCSIKPLILISKEDFFDPLQCQNWRYEDTGETVSANTAVYREALEFFYTEIKTKRRVICCVAAPTSEEFFFLQGSHRVYTEGASVHPLIFEAVREKFTTPHLFTDANNMANKLKNKKTNFYYAGKDAPPDALAAGVPLADLCGYPIPDGAEFYWSEWVLTGMTARTDEILSKQTALGVIRSRLAPYLANQCPPRARGSVKSNIKGLRLLHWGLTDDGSDAEFTWMNEGPERESFAVPHWTGAIQSPSRFNPFAASRTTEGKGCLDFFGANHLVIYGTNYLKRPDGLPVCSSRVPNRPPDALLTLDIYTPREIKYEDWVGESRGWTAKARGYLPSPYETSEAWLEFTYFEAKEKTFGVLPSWMKEALDFYLV